jgi:hypothetical protein
MSRLPLLPVIALLGVVAAGCGSSSPSSTAATATATAAQTAADAAAATPAATTAAATATATTAATPAATAKPASGSKAITAPGTTLALGKPARVKQAYNVTGGKGTLEVQPMSVKKGKISDLSNFKLDAQTKKGTPFYITVHFKSLAPKSFKQTGFMGLMTVSNKSGDPANNLTLLGTFTPCQGTVPDTLKAGAEFTICEVYVLPKGQSVKKLNYSDGNNEGVDWPVK